MGLSFQKRRFADEYLVDFKASQAAVRAGWSEVSAGQTAYRLLMDIEVMDYINAKVTERAQLADISAAWVLSEWKKIASADPNEIIWHENECCRHCYGVGHAYEWTKWEYAHAVEQAARHVCNPKCGQPCESRMPPDGTGGFGYTPHRVPVESCPVCHGRGLARVCVADTRRLRGSARRLYAGVKTTQYGIEVKMRDQDGALKNIAQYLGMLIEKRETSGPNGGPIPIASNITARDLTDDQLAQFIFQERERERERLAELAAEAISSS